MCHIRLSRAREVAARFEKISPVQVSLKTEGPGDILGEGNAPLCSVSKQRCSIAVEPGRDIILKAYPKSGHLFIGWVGACGSRESECRMKATGAFGVKALFE